jgi:polyhydroxyalkanoate synthesis regulator phasin
MNILKDALDLGLGAVVLTKEKADKIARELVKKGRLQEKERKGLVDDLIKRGKEEEKCLEKKLANMINSAFSSMDIASKSDIARLEKEIKKIASR